MTEIAHCCYNMDTNCVELTYNDGSVLSIDCEEVENAYDVTTRQMSDLDWLIYNSPLEYAQLVLSGEMVQYLSGTTLHGLEDWPVLLCYLVVQAKYIPVAFLTFLVLHGKM